MLTPDTGLGVIFSGFTNAYGSGSTHLERLSSTSINVLEVLRSWSGELQGRTDSAGESSEVDRLGFHRSNAVLHARPWLYKGLS
jgi:hypothetical protein